MSTYDAGRQRSDTPPAQTRPDTPEYTAARPAAPERQHPDDVVYEQAVRLYPVLVLLEALHTIAADPPAGGRLLDGLPMEMYPHTPRDLARLDPADAVLVAMAATLAEAYEELADAVREWHRQEVRT